jgi:ABC-type oligopeptide transport system substrate-binding subunit
MNRIRSLLAQEIVIALGSEPTTLDPQLREDGGERAVNDNIYETLMARKPDGSLVPGLAAGRAPASGPLDLGSQAAPGHQLPQR